MEFGLFRTSDWIKYLEEESYPEPRDFLVLPLFVLLFPSLRLFLDIFVFERLARWLIFGKEQKKVETPDTRKRINKFKERKFGYRDCTCFAMSQVGTSFTLSQRSNYASTCSTNGQWRPIFYSEVLESNESQMRTAAVWAIINLTFPSSPCASSRLCLLLLLLLHCHPLLPTPTTNLQIPSPHACSPSTTIHAGIDGAPSAAPSTTGLTDCSMMATWTLGFLLSS